MANIKVIGTSTSTTSKLYSPNAPTMRRLAKLFERLVVEGNADTDTMHPLMELADGVDADEAMREHGTDMIEVGIRVGAAAAQRGVKQVFRCDTEEGIVYYFARNADDLVEQFNNIAAETF